MPYGLYISAEGAQVQSRRMEVIANNIANVDTVGFKRDLAVMQSRYAEAIERGIGIAGRRDDQRYRRRRAISPDRDRFLPRTAAKDRKPNRRGPAGRRFLRRPKGPGTAAHAGRQFSPHGRRRPGYAAGIPGSRRGQLADHAQPHGGPLGNRFLGQRNPRTARGRNCRSSSRPRWATWSRAARTSSAR